MNRNILEISSYSLVPGIEESQFVRAADDAMSVLRRQRGFLARSIAQAEDGSWTEIVHWLDRESARAAGERLAGHPDAAAFSALIDRPSFQSGYYPVAYSG
ncbi:MULTISPECIES: hypothetical protein [Kaistia]|uniref:ABM domain-containing protein n=1 Tax=Kaistia nematophila TaxID=2994654 RepID=A0A9X3E0P8_9HYPH|nr:hypothetical protein [Kaistia nematophila]MBN9024912.1 hypothetical protein [Hyphomicrobiales bacterium]MBN9059837.1 hypothetical protein [Hyphomicrobiales bacterium]MCX5568853.1 hypothetical protein [Kaistia nematophila]